ncbi:hypothetical protein BDZ91DRAFT_727008, partial [Kalaharituber pfeilii]
ELGWCCFGVLEVVGIGGFRSFSCCGCVDMGFGKDYVICMYRKRERKGRLEGLDSVGMEGDVMGVRGLGSGGYGMLRLRKWICCGLEGVRRCMYGGPEGQQFGVQRAAERSGSRA